jgi:YD repeat-containing protein
VSAGAAGAVASIARPDDICPGNAATSEALTAPDSRTSMSGPDGSKTEVLLENGHLIREIIAPDKSTMRITYNDDMLPVLVERPGGSELTFKYNDRSDLIERRDEALAATERYEYDTNGLRVRHWDAKGRERRWVYDDRGNLLEEHAGAASIVTTYERDTFGQVIRQLGKGLETHYEYDARGNMTRLRVPGVVDVTYEHDAAGNLLVQAQGTRRAQASYDAFNRLLEIGDNEGTTRYLYDPRGRLREITDALGRKHTREYDVRGSLIRRTDAAGRAWEYEHDDAGRVLAEVRPDGMRIAHTYDSAGKEILVSAGGEQIEREYGWEDRLISARYAGSKITNDYDDSGRLVAQTLTFPGDRSIRLKFEYDQSGKRTAVRPVEIGATVYRRYDADTGVLTRVECGETWWIEIDGDAHGRVKTARRGNGVETRLSYDGTARLCEAVSTGPDAAELYTYSARFDEQGDCVSTGGWTFAHDACGRLAEAARVFSE